MLAWTASHSAGFVTIGPFESSVDSIANMFKWPFLWNADCGHFVSPVLLVYVSRGCVAPPAGRCPGARSYKYNAVRRVGMLDMSYELKYF